MDFEDLDEEEERRAGDAEASFLYELSFMVSLRLLLYALLFVWIDLSNLGWRYLSNATCIRRPPWFYASFAVSRITIACYSIRHV